MEALCFLANSRGTAAAAYKVFSIEWHSRRESRVRISRPGVPPAVPDPVSAPSAAVPARCAHAVGILAAEVAPRVGVGHAKCSPMPGDLPSLFLNLLRPFLSSHLRDGMQVHAP